MRSKSDKKSPKRREMLKIFLGWLSWLVVCCALFYLGKHHYHIINVNLFLLILFFLSFLLLLGLLWITNRLNDSSKDNI